MHVFSTYLVRIHSTEGKPMHNDYISKTGDTQGTLLTNYQIMTFFTVNEIRLFCSLKSIVVEVCMPKPASLVQNCLKCLRDIESVCTSLAYTL